jgi:hypothetical protein
MRSSLARATWFAARRRASAVVAALLGATATCNPPEVYHCGALGCVSQVSLVTTLQAAPSELAGLVIEVCRNDACVRSQPVLSQDGSGFTCDTYGPLAMSCRIAPPGSAGGSADQPTLTLRISGRADDFVDGDHYVVRVGRAGAPPLVFIDKTVRYTEDAPNGPDCAPVCRVASLS